MEEHLEGVAFPPRAMGAAEGQMVRPGHSRRYACSWALNRRPPPFDNPQRTSVLVRVIGRSSTN